ncbi:hypothetical protein R1sor_015205 [Riccia sorocarpa]|uniref:SWIM-type domain-containing protein n=1 Tax=Riccia sorocarpa TaxID=122646 RepID=A0ABD3HDI8_9MARC
MMASMRNCKRCGRVNLPLSEFKRARAGSKTSLLKIHSQCNRCAEVRRSREERNRGNGVTEVPVSGGADGEEDEVPDYQNADGVEVLAVRCSSESFSHTLEDVFKTAEAGDGVVFACFEIAMSDSWAAGDMDSWSTSEGLLAYKTWLKSILLPELDLGSGTYWELRRFSQCKRKSHEFSAVFWCSCRDDRTAGRKTMESQRPRQSEKRRKIERSACKGCARVTINSSTLICSLEIVHMERHGKPHWRENKMPTAAIEYMEAKAEVGIRRQEVYRLLTEEGLINPAQITRAQVNYWVDEIESWLYGNNEVDQQLGASKFIRSEAMKEKEFAEVLYEDNDQFQAFAFTTHFWRHIKSVKDVLTDSTFKTNAMRFELFALVANLGGFGVPLSYLFYRKKVNINEVEVSDGGLTTIRIGVLTNWLESLRGKGLMPTFFITDKDLGQIKAAQTALPRTYVQLCLKHSLDAVKKRMESSDKGTNPYSPVEANKRFDFIDQSWQPASDGRVIGSVCPEHFRREVSIIFKQHCNLHPLIPDVSGNFLSSDALHEVAVLEMYSYCRDRDLVILWAYMWNEWYRDSNWALFSRASKHVLCMSRTTNLVESHWRKLKQDYSNCMNRPRLDKLVHLIATRFIRDMEVSLTQFLRGREFPVWWRKFKRTWRKLLIRDHSEVGFYRTDLTRWSCSCPAFVKAKYLLCKHLVRGFVEEHRSRKPVYNETYRRFNPPFYVFGRKEDFFSWSVLSGRLDPWLGFECESNPGPFEFNGLQLRHRKMQVQTLPAHGRMGPRQRGWVRFPLRGTAPGATSPEREGAGRSGDRRDRREGSGSRRTGSGNDREGVGCPLGTSGTGRGMRPHFDWNRPKGAGKTGNVREGIWTSLRERLFDLIAESGQPRSRGIEDGSQSSPHSMPQALPRRESDDSGSDPDEGAAPARGIAVPPGFGTVPQDALLNGQNIALVVSDEMLLDQFPDYVDTGKTRRSSVSGMLAKGRIRLMADYRSERMLAAVPAAYPQYFPLDYKDKGLPAAGTRKAFDKAFCKLLYAQQHLLRNVDFNRPGKQHKKRPRSPPKSQSEAPADGGWTPPADPQYEAEPETEPEADDTPGPSSLLRPSQLEAAKREIGQLKRQIQQLKSAAEKDKDLRAEAEVLRRALVETRVRLQATAVDTEVLKRELQASTEKRAIDLAALQAECERLKIE